ncbi:MAG TPA: TlpA disulfide reductase family protein [Gaiellaceae bacterium]|jgi:cytochrome c biogenesis protein CcmG/thiol:disulfide interchange protein DsbE|nr:TlpA disulfide reductase family protein [Gaiellaceae bacterium]
MSARPLRLALQALALAGVAGLLVLLVWKLTHDPGGGIAGQLSRGKEPSAPNFTLERLDGSGTVELASIEKPRVLDFFASWCYACPYESKRLQKYSREYGDRIAFIGVNTDDFGGDAKRYVRRYGLTYTVVREQGRKILNEWGGLPLPRIFFIDRAGKVIGQLEVEEDLPRYLKRLAADA